MTSAISKGSDIVQSIAAAGHDPLGAAILKNDRKVLESTGLATSAGAAAPAAAVAAPAAASRADGAAVSVRQSMNVQRAAAIADSGNDAPDLLGFSAVSRKKVGQARMILG